MIEYEIYEIKLNVCYNNFDFLEYLNMWYYMVYKS